VTQKWSQTQQKKQKIMVDRFITIKMEAVIDLKNGSLPYKKEKK